MPTPIARRVTHRHQAAVVEAALPERLRLNYSDAGTVTADDLTKLLEPKLGKLVQLRLLSALDGGIVWEAIDLGVRQYSGRVIIRTVLTREAVTSWVEVTVGCGP
jgi:hypothetical protein